MNASMTVRPGTSTSLPGTHPDRFELRHIGPTGIQEADMLVALGQANTNALVEQIIPPQIQLDTPIKLPDGLHEAQALSALKAFAEDNQQWRSFIGEGYHNTHMPAVIQRNVFENPGWYTPYTPYQAEIAQGRLEGLLAYQTMICELTGMELAGASLLDEATAVAEALHLAVAASRGKKTRFLVADGLHTRSKAVVTTRAAGQDWSVDLFSDLPDEIPADTAAIIVQSPATNGTIIDLAPLAEKAHAAKALLVVATDLLACTMVTPPGEQGADVVVGSAQRFGLPLGFGGPHAAFMAVQAKHARQLPGRLVGVSVDRHGNRALRLALQTREQHIRREKATSNICTAQALLANLAGFYGIWHGGHGLRAIAARIHRAANLLHEAVDLEGANDTWFDTLTFHVSDAQQAAIKARAAEKQINLAYPCAHTVRIALDETVDDQTVLDLIQVLTGKDHYLEDIAPLQGDEGIGGGHRRRSGFMEQEVFNTYTSETAMMRWLRKLERKDIGLDRSMIPLGSCTMKLNAAATMLSLTNPGLAGIHPLAPKEQTQGWIDLLEDLEERLARITGFVACSLQPNAGSQGELAGLLAIKSYHEARNDGHRRVCLIPKSAHGTNPASAVMAGMRVITVACDDQGNIDVDDLRCKAVTHQKELAALMVTYPSTHGVFETSIQEICDIIHESGGMVYLDGANMNAMVGWTSPGTIGADVCHLNLHKTFAIPHGGGGPGVGPICVNKHLAPYLPDRGLGVGDGAISQAPFGSALVCAISWAYCAMMGGDGLKAATAQAILSANYMAARLDKAYPVLYRGAGGYVAHECIVDLRHLKDNTGIEVEDVAKRLIDYGFHAPTVSFPVAGTLMIEPTESENLAEIDRFCDAMLAIREEIQQIADGTWTQEDNPVVNAPHTASEVTANEWHHAYSRETAAYPLPWLKEDKYWPPVARVDNAHGDRNLFCSCG